MFNFVFKNSNFSVLVPSTDTNLSSFSICTSVNLSSLNSFFTPSIPIFSNLSIINTEVVSLSFGIPADSSTESNIFLLLTLNCTSSFNSLNIFNPRFIISISDNIFALPTISASH